MIGRELSAEFDFFGAKYVHHSGNEFYPPKVNPLREPTSPPWRRKPATGISLNRPPLRIGLTPIEHPNGAMAEPIASPYVEFQFCRGVQSGRGACNLFEFLTIASLALSCDASDGFCVRVPAGGNIRNIVVTGVRSTAVCLRNESTSEQFLRLLPNSKGWRVELGPDIRQCHNPLVS